MANQVTDVKLINNSALVRKAFASQVENGLVAIGIKAEEYAKADCPVDTGRLRNSITYATHEHKGRARQGGTYQKSDSVKLGTPEKGTVYIGTNVEYAEPVETMNRPHKTGKAHFLRDAATQHNDEYKRTMKKSLETK